MNGEIVLLNLAMLKEWPVKTIENAIIMVKLALNLALKTDIVGTIVWETHYTYQLLSSMFVVLTNAKANSDLSIIDFIKNYIDIFLNIEFYYFLFWDMLYRQDSGE